jgi:hypothetical protein
MKTWPFAAGASALALTAGVLIAGLPTSGDSFVLDAEPVSAVSDPPVPVAAETAALPVVPVATTEAPAPVLVAMPAESDDDGLISTVQVAPSTTSAPADITLERADIDLVVANGAREAGLASEVAATLDELGYVDIHVGNAITAVDVTIIYFAPGFKDEAMRLAVDLSLPDVELLEMPDTPLLADDSYTSEHLTVVLGRDALG